MSNLDAAALAKRVELVGDQIDALEAKVETGLTKAVAERDRWRRLFNRLDAAITHHKAATEPFGSNADESLWAARDRVVRDAHQDT